MTEAQNAPAEA